MTHEICTKKSPLSTMAFIQKNLVDHTQSRETGVPEKKKLPTRRTSKALLGEVEAKHDENQRECSYFKFSIKQQAIRLTVWAWGLAMAFSEVLSLLLDLH